MFDPGREGFAKGEIVWTATPTIKVGLIRGYTFDATDKFVSDLTGGTIHASVTLASLTATNGICDAADATFTTPAANANNHYLVIYQSSAVGGGADVATSAQRLICYIDTATGLTALQPNGADITITWDNGANKIFKL